MVRFPLQQQGLLAPSWPPGLGRQGLCFPALLHPAPNFALRLGPAGIVAQGADPRSKPPTGSVATHRGQLAALLSCPARSTRPRRAQLGWGEGEESCRQSPGRSNQPLPRSPLLGDPRANKVRPGRFRSVPSSAPWTPRLSVSLVPAGGSRKGSGHAGRGDGQSGQAAPAGRRRGQVRNGGNRVRGRATTAAAAASEGGGARRKHGVG